ncbi:MAG: outer membrane protein assembly factor BamD [Geminicoccaceae bacterium]
MACTLMLCLGLAACGDLPDPETATVIEEPVDVLYNRAAALADEGNHTDAAVAFEEVERQHPYSEWATRSMLMASYSYYMALQYDEAIFAAQRFVDLHPGNKDVDHAYYLIARSYYDQLSDIRRDQGMTESAIRAFEEVIGRFPETDYARDAELKLVLARDHLAGKEMDIGRYYLNRQEYVAAINRFRSVVERYQTTTHVPEALHRLVEAYMALGVREEARVAAAYLGHNYPGSEWYGRSYALLEGEGLEPATEEGSWLSSLF